ncbi:hypothetical protein WEI85_41415 [Actinomycetes bacterium KLBMP 9797]
MTADLDGVFVDRVRAALADRIRMIVNEAGLDAAGGDAWRSLQHRQLAERIKALVVTGDEELFGHAVTLATRLRGLQGPSGLFTGGDNVDSPPDSAFSINDLADALRLLRHTGATAGPLTALLEELLTAALPALVGGGVHTPNHRWEISAALARLHLLWPQPALAGRVDEWLAEGVDIDADGLYSERSANYAAYVSNPSLLTIADVFNRKDLVDAVERNLDATLDLLLPDGTVETVLSRRQDQHRPVLLAGFLLPLRRVAQLRQRGDLAWAAGLALGQGVILPAEAATQLVLEPGIARPLPAPVPPERPRQRVFGAAGLLVDHGPAATTVLFGGSDFPRHRQIRSGLANSPTFLRLFAGEAALESVRLSRTFFSFGPFRADGLTVERDQEGTTVTLAETVAAGYYQPLASEDRDSRGDYRLVDEGRFSAQMDFGRRTRDEVTLTTTVRARIADAGREAAGVLLTVEMTGAVVDWALELAFRPGGTMTGARALGADRWQLDAPAAAAGPVAATYQVNNDAITVALMAASDRHGGPLPATSSVPGYEPGEEYRFLGGTDAATGTLLYVAGRVPARVQLLLATQAP